MRLIVLPIAICAWSLLAFVTLEPIFGGTQIKADLNSLPSSSLFVHSYIPALIFATILGIFENCGNCA